MSKSRDKASRFLGRLAEISGTACERPDSLTSYLPSSSQKSSKVANGRSKMPRGSKPGERRGGRQRGTPNKSTLLKHAAFEAAATDPNLSPLDFLLKLMRQGDLPLELRVTVAQQALPFTHPKPKPDKPIKPKPDKPIKGTYGDSRNGVNEKIGARVKVVKVNADDACSDSVTPLDFLLGVMRDAESPAALRLRVVGIVAPYVHRKGEPIEVGEPPVAMVVVEDPYGFDADIADKLETINREQERLRAFEPRLSDVKSSSEFIAAQEKATQTTAYLELAKSIEEQQAALRCPPTYRELDSRKDRARLKELNAESEGRPLTAAEQIEQKHLQARLAAYSRTPESADCDRMNFLKGLGADLCTPEEKEELERLEARYPEVPLDRTRAVPRATETLRRMLSGRKAESG
jgi:hypothetical protein